MFAGLDPVGPKDGFKIKFEELRIVLPRKTLIKMRSLENTYQLVLSSSWKKNKEHVKKANQPLKKVEFYFLSSRI